MDSISGDERGLREAAGITGLAGAFQAMDQNQFSVWRRFRTLRVDFDLNSRLRLIDRFCDREPSFIESAPPEITRNRG